jgi:hypothetical protein
MVDAPPIGRLLGPNLTLGRGSRTAQYRATDWDRIVRHGIKPNGRPAAMPSEDFVRMSDQELSDIIAFIRSQPPVDNEVAPVKLGPLGKVLMATGQMVLSADVIPSHDAPHAAYQQFVAALREGKRPDGTFLRVPMLLLQPYALKMTDVELPALWTYLQSVPPAPSHN